MKILLSSKALSFVLVTMVLVGCGGSDSGGKSKSSSSASVVASSAPSSVEASSSSSVVEASSAPSSVASSSEASSNSSEASSSAPSAALVIYEDAILPAWKAWDCCGGSTPVEVVASEVEHGNVVNFEINGSTVVGFSSRTAHGAVGGAVFDATSIKTTGTISFDLKMTTAPSAGVGVWKFKVESNNAASAAEVNLSTSHEGHSAPVLNTWQTYTFNLSALETAGVNLASLDLFMVFPAWGTGDGADFQIDNMKIWATGAVTPE